MDNSSEKVFIEYVPGIASTTGRDLHGHRATKEQLETWAKQINDPNHPVKLSFHHNSEEPVGEWIAAEVVSCGDFSALAAIAGIYGGHSEAIRRLNNGNFGGLSIKAEDYVNTSLDEWTKADEKVRIEVDGSWTESIQEILKAHNSKYRFEINKSALGFALFEVIIENFDTIAKTVIMIHAYWKFQERIFSQEGADIEEVYRKPEVKLPNGENIDLTEFEPGDIIDVIRENGYEASITPEEAETLANETEQNLEETLEVNSEDE